ncbi:GNAT family N-acetyltransferase [Knoellia sp. 3-2P3]|uniref:GNAT family N-acetyltransferase n=1 Tax=unclassified Knoellia TaxID=2618719 RepID=UPI0023DAFCC4|nr:GNAT family N-acetyltransferase [Knoellia sp. 3-2P3]MDF2092911.1 GNAT family N-acetyltransferase [Knoellia sp. 3-2P3]
MSTDGVVRVEPLTPARWDDAVAVFGTRGDPASCWCQFFRLAGQHWRESTRASNRDALQAQVLDAGAAAPGLLAYSGGEPAGWVAVAPRAGYSRLGRHRALATVVGADTLTDPSVWSVTCFVVRVGFRRRGVATALLEAAVEFAAAQGASAVEGYPVAVAPGERRASSELYHGTRSTFVAAGFEEVGRTSPARPVMRRVLA